MTENGDPLENAVAERINGILKQEYMSHYQINSIDEARKCLEFAVHLYNKERPHLSLGMLKPDDVHQYQLHFTPTWKKRMSKSLTVNLFQDLF